MHTSSGEKAVEDRATALATGERRAKARHIMSSSDKQTTQCF
jgi:hypothetical protein